MSEQDNGQLRFTSNQKKGMVMVLLSVIAYALPPLLYEIPIPSEFILLYIAMMPVLIVGFVSILKVFDD